MQSDTVQSGDGERAGFHTGKKRLDPKKDELASLGLTIRKFSILAEAAMKFMLDKAHPERMEPDENPKGPQGRKADKMYGWAELFLQHEGGLVKRIFSENGNLKWPRHEIIKKICPILRRIRINEQRRKKDASKRALDRNVAAAQGQLRSLAKVAEFARPPPQILDSVACTILAQFNGSNLTYQLDVWQNGTLMLAQVNFKLKDCPGLQQLVKHVDTYLKNFNAKRSNIKVFTPNGWLMPVNSMIIWAEAVTWVTSDKDFDGYVSVVVNTH